MSNERIVVTGASGFLGTTVADALSQERYRVRRMVRRAPSFGSEVAVVPDILDRAAVRRALTGVDGVIHLAAHVHEMVTTPELSREFRRINVDGTRLLLEEAKAAGVRKFVFFSSVKAVGDRNEIPWTETTPPHPRDAYGISKLEAESLVLELTDHSDVSASILRLPLAYGPRMKGNMLRLFDAVRRGIPLPFQGVQNKRSVVYSENVAEAVVRCLRSPPAARQIFFLSDGYDVSTPELIAQIGAALGKTPRLFRLPRPFLIALARVGDALERPGRPFPINSQTVERLVGSLTVDSSKLRLLTGYQPRYSTADGIRRTAAWYVNRTNPGRETLTIRSD